MKALALSLWHFRGYILGAVRREFELRYVRSLFGFVWTILEPLSMILVYTLIFSTVMKARLPGLDDSWSYSIYLCTGILYWTLFSEVVNRCQTMFLAEANLLKKTDFPRLALPSVVLLTAALNFAIFMFLFVCFLAIIDRLPGYEILLLILPSSLILLLAVGFGVLTGTLNVFFRDVGKSVGILLTFWFWLTPIVYPIEIIPNDFQDVILTFNPVAPVIAFAQGIMLQSTVEDLNTLIFPLTVALSMLGLGFVAFRRLAADLVDEL